MKDVLVESKIVAGGGAPEIEVALALRDFAKSLAGKAQLAVEKFAEALEVIPMQLAENAGLDPIEAIVSLRAKHKEGGNWIGVNVMEGKFSDMYKLEILEPLLVKKQAIKAAVEAAAMILKIDDIIAASRLEEKKEKGYGQEESSFEQE